MTRVVALALVLVVLGAAGASAAGGGGLREIHRLTAADISPIPSLASPEAPAAWCGSASQTDRAPNVVAGNPLHWVYAIPSDGADNLASVASVMQSDAEQIDGWWRREDPTRVPRNDLATFSCGTQLDVTTLRMTQTSAQLSSADGRFLAIAEALDRNGLSSQFTKYVVYYDGPTTDADVCGVGGSDSSGWGVAATYLRACAGVPPVTTTAHEFLHTVDAVPEAAPNECEGETSGHTCDDVRDIMYPFGDEDPLSAKFLDPGRNDYYGHAGGWTDSQDSAWLVRLDAQAPFGLTIRGPGSVAADVPGLSCAASCTTTWNNAQRLALTATPGSGAKLVRWTGSCSGAAGCTVAVGSGVSVTALFAPATYRLAVAVDGRGTVRGPAGITCRPRCSAALPSHAPARLTAVPAPGWKLRSWGGACKGAKRTCAVPMTAVTNVRARFVRQ